MPNRRTQSPTRSSGNPPKAPTSLPDGRGNLPDGLLPKFAREFLHLQDPSGVLPASAVQLLELLPVPVYTCDAEGRIANFNEAAVALWGRAPVPGVTRWCGAWALERVDGSPLALEECLMAITVKEGRATTGMEVVVVREDGTRRHVMPHPRPLFAADGKPAGGINILVDITERRASEREAVAAAQRLNFAMVAAKMGDWMWDAATDRLRLTGRVAEIIGLPSGGEISREDLRALVHPDDLAGTKQIVSAAMEARADYDMEYRLRQPSGDYTWVGVKGRGVFDAQGKLVAVVGIIQDIDERKTAELKWRAHDAQLRFISSDAPTMLSHFDREGRLLFANKAFADWWERAPADLLGRTLADVAGRAAAEAIAPYVQRVLQGERVDFEVELESERRGRRHVTWTFAPEFGPQREARGWLAAATDITDRWRTEEALRESEARLRLAAKSGRLGVWDWDVVNDRVAWSDPLFEAHGVDRAAVPATLTAFLALIHAEDRKPVQRAIGSSLEHDVPFELEFRVLRPGGAVSWMFMNALVQREAGKPVRMLGTTFDITARKQAELGLRESEMRFRTLASNAPVGIFLTDMNGHSVFVNETWRALAGMTSEQARGTGWAGAVHPEDRTRVTVEWQAAVAERRAFNIEHRLLRPDGTISWVQCSAVDFRNAHGGLVGYLGTVMDITQRKGAEERLRAREAELRLITTNAPIILAHCDRDQRYLFVNRAYCERFNREFDAVLGRTVRDVLGAEAHAALRPHIERVLGGETFTFETEIPYRDVGQRFMRAAFTPDFADDGSVRGFLCAISDLTERRQMEMALRDSEARFRQLADSMPQIVFAADANGVTDYFNQRWYELTEARGGVVGDESFLPVLHPDDRARCLETWYRCVKTGQPYQIEYRFRLAASDEYRWHLGRALPVRDDQDRIVRWFGTCTDIHDWKLVQEQLREAQQQLQAHADDLERRVAERTASLREAIVQMEEFSYSVSHDLRAPLRAMNAYAQALVEDYGAQLDETGRSYLDRIQRSSIRMEKLTHDVLTYSRVARTEVRLTPLNLEVLLRDVVMQYRELQAPAANVEIDAPLLGVRGHESSLGQCLANLLTNAAKFVAPGVQPRIRVRTEPVGERVRIWFEDNGIGIAPEYQARLFRVFERVPTSHAYSGTGIGLAIVRKAMEKMGGACGVLSDGSAGSRFWIELPKAT